MLVTLAMLGVIVLASLGKWQLDRLVWKRDLLNRLESRIDGEPVDLPPAAEWSQDSFAAAFEYRPVTLSGQFDIPGDGRDFRRYYSYTVLTHPRGGAGGQGYWVMDLFRPETGGALYINRGFVPLADRGLEAAAPVGFVTLVGLLRQPLRGNVFTPSCDAEAPICYANDVEKIASDAGLSAAPFFIDLAAEHTAVGGLPQSGETRLSFPNSHLQYAVTWFGLAAGLLGVLAAYLASARRAQKRQA